MPLAYFYIWKLNLGLYGYALLRFTIEIINFIGLIITSKCYMDKRAYDFNEKFSEVFAWEPLKIYIIEFWPVLYGWYSSYIALELVIVIVGNTHDIEFLASWVITFQVTIFAFVCSAGISQITRTDIILPIQQNQPNKAKKYAYLGLILKSILVVLMGSFVMIFGRQISEIFSS